MQPLMTQSWHSIHQYYVNLATFDAEEREVPWLTPMLDFVQAIKQSRYAVYLHAWTSMCDLCIVQLPVYYPHGYPHLRISPLVNNMLAFRYVDTPQRVQQWYRETTGTGAFPRFERFLQQLHWFEYIPMQ